MLDQGRKLAEGTPGEIVQQPGGPGGLSRWLIPSLSIKDLRAGYGSLDILNGVDLDVPQGQFVALMGPNGAGKSTLLKTLYGMTTIKGGSISWQGKDIAGLQIAGDPRRKASPSCHRAAAISRS